MPRIVDPIFHLTIPSSSYAKGFDEVPYAVLQECGTAVRPAASYRYWYLAKAKAGGWTYVMIDGLVKDNAGAGWSADENGSFLRLNGSTCTAIDPADGVFQYYQSYAEDDGMNIDAPVFQALAADAVRRYARAFGSKAQFVAVLHAQGRYPKGPELQLFEAALSR